MSKFARRYRRGLVTAGVLATALLVAVGAIAGSVGWVIRDDAARRAEAVRDAQTSMAHEMNGAERMLAEGRRLEAVAAWERADRLADRVGPDPVLRDRLADLKRQLDEAATIWALRWKRPATRPARLPHTAGPWKSPPPRAETHFGLGNVLRRTGNLEGALEGYKRAVAIDPTHAKAHYAIARALSRKDRKGTIAALQRAIDLGLGLESPRVYVELGGQLQATGDLPGAIAAYRKAIEGGTVTRPSTPISAAPCTRPATGRGRWPRSAGPSRSNRRPPPPAPTWASTSG